MLIWVLRILSYIFLAYLLYFSQEMGRYLIGRWIGVPADKIRMAMFAFPQQVEIYDGEKWVASDQEEYLSAYARYDPLWNYGFLYACSGLYTESILLVIITIIFSVGGWQEVALAAIIISLGLSFLQMAYSIYVSWRKDAIKGDYTIIHRLDARRSLAYVVVHFLLRIILLSFL